MTLPENIDGHAREQIHVSVVIVNYNVRDFLAQALRSVYQATGGLRVETIVVDNNSIDGSVGMVRADFPHVTVIANRENIGFGSANNQAIRQSSGTYVFILNPDTIVQEDTLTELVRYMDGRPDCGAVGPQILNPDGSFAPESRRSFPTPEAAFYRLTGLSRLFPRSRIFGKYNLTYLDKDEESAVDALSGSCMLVRRQALDEAGLFDEAFFMYGEDLDLCYRIQQAGWGIRYNPATRIIHYKGESTRKGEIRYVRLFYGAMLLFIEKHLENRHSRVMFGLLRAGIMMRAAGTVIGSWIRTAAAPLTDAAIAWLVVSLAGLLRSGAADAPAHPFLFLIVAPAFALSTLLGVAAMGCYRRSILPPVRRVVGGVVLGFLLTSAFFYFARSLAFSRIIIATSMPVTAAALIAWRVFSGLYRNQSLAILVGGSDETRRLRRLLSSHPMPPFRLVGHVSEEGTSEAGSNGHMGGISHLRDLVRLKGIRDIVFAARDVSNQTIFETMQNLRDLPVHFRMMNEGKEHIIGKSSINHLTYSELQTDLPEVALRSVTVRNLYQRILSLILLPLLPIIWLAARLNGNKSQAAKAWSRFRHLPQVVMGRKALVGIDAMHVSLVPSAWRLPVGVFSVTNTLNAEELEQDDVLRAYWFYLTHQTTGLDWDIIVASTRQKGTSFPHN